MLSRALSLATVTLLIGCFAAAPGWAQAQNLEAGKSPSQIFGGTCTACHKSPHGLLKTVPAGSLPGFLRQHYTTSGEMASLLSAFLISNGAADSRYVGAQTKPGADAKPGTDAKPGAPSEQLDRQGRNAKRLARPAEAPDATKPALEGQAPAQAASERGPDGRKLTAKQRLSKRGRPGVDEAPKTDAAKTDAAKTDAAKNEPAGGEAVKDDKPKSEAAKDEAAKPEAAKPANEGKSEAARIEAPKDTAKDTVKDSSKNSGNGETPVLRADPVPPVTPAPPASAEKSAAIPGSPPEPAAAPPASSPPPPAASAPPPAPVAPAGPPAPPISQ